MPHPSGEAVALLTLGPAHGSQWAIREPAPNELLFPLQPDLTAYYRATDAYMRVDGLRSARYSKRWELLDPKHRAHYIYEYAGERS